jgi:uncharacterized protein YhjY with autotransporter beta-barrel domain
MPDRTQQTIFRSGRFGACLAAAVFGASVESAFAANAVYQNYFATACATPTGTFATRCGETTNGNLSGDSESSLNPSQPLSSQTSALAQARSKSLEASDKMEEQRAGGEGATNVGTFSFLLNGRRADFDQTRATTDSERGLEGDTTAFEIGADYRASTRTVFGGFMDYQRTSATFDADRPTGTPFTPQPNSGAIDSEVSGLTLFGSHNFNDRFYVEGSLGYRFGDYEFERNAVFQESTRTTAQTNVQAVGKTDGTQYFVSLGVGLEAGRGAFSLSPHVRATLSKSMLDDYTETDRNNSGLQMNVEVNDRTSRTVNLGVSMSYAISTGGAVVVPQARVEWEHEFEQDAQQVTTSFALDTSENEFELTGDKPDRDYYNVGFSLVGVFARGWMAFADYQRVIGYDDLERNEYTLGLRIEL